ncbi:Ig-like domain-containing protein [Acinetobacter bohemicus]|uniref:BapA/Bap/LapF family large adhesin n=1 Tax=Acinetobacter sp. S4397-1 TaxID=2972915 RepID=UPI00209B3341|nr:BapA/Bap/LapF family large adhesin [Acinetobacter sp. S4397-1]MCO8044257.1 Ig-like domain-containing protein [Acinetobacter sp. S4397-1]
MTGKGEPGSEIVVTDKDGNILGTGTVDENGDFVVPVNPALTDGNTADVIAKDEAGNESEPVEITGEKDTIAPAVPTDVVMGEDGLTVSGKAEAGSTVDVTDKNGNVIGTGTADENGDFAIELKRPVTDGEVVDVTAKDQAGNTSEPTEVTGNKDTIAPDAPEVAIDDSYSVLTVKTEPNATVKPYDSEGNPMLDSNGNPIEIKADANGDVTYEFSPALERGSELKVTATDEAGNESAPVDIIVGVDEIFGAVDNNVDVILDATPSRKENQNPSDLDKTGFTVANVGLGPVLGLDVLADVIKNSVQLEVGKDQVREVTMYGDAGGIQVLATMDLYVYKLNESTGQWEQQSVTENWVISYLLGGKSKETDFTLTEGKWMFVMAGGEGIQALTGYGLNFTKDVVLDYANAESISGSAQGNMITDDDSEYGSDEVPAGSTVTEIKAEDGEWVSTSTSGEIQIEGKYGTLTVKADGSYTYTVNEDFRGYGEKDVFTYRVTSPSGKVSEAELTFELDLTAKEDRIEIDNTVILDVDPIIAFDSDNSSIADAVGFSVIDIGLLGPILSAEALGGAGAMEFNVGENEVKELTFHGSAGGVALGVGYDLFIYKLDPATGNYNQVHVQKDWFMAAFLGGKSEQLTLQFGEGEYKALLQSSGGLGLLTGAGLYVDHETVYDYGSPTKFTGTVEGDATPEDSTILLKVDGEDLKVGKETVIQGEYGTLVISSDGTYTYTVEKPDNAPLDWKPPYGEVDRFKLVMQDENGKTTVEYLNIKVGTHSAEDDFDIVSVSETNKVSKIEYNEVDKIGNYGKSYTKEFDVAKHDLDAGVKLKITGSPTIIGPLGSYLVLTYTLTNATTGKIYSDRVEAARGKDGALEFTLDNLPEGKYKLDITAQNGNLESIHFVTDEIIHSEEYVTTELPEIKGALFANDEGIQILDTLSFGNKVVFVNDPNQGAQTITVEGNYGTLVIGKDGSYTYTPKGGVYGIEKFVYETTSKVGTIETAILEINVGKTVTASEHADSVDSSAGNDSFTMGTGGDTVIFDLLADDNVGGNGHDVWNDFSMEEGDKIEVSDLLSEGTTLADAITLTEDAEGNVVLNIDRDGTAGTSYQSESFLTLVGVEKTDTLLDDLINNGYLF